MTIESNALCMGCYMAVEWCVCDDEVFDHEYVGEAVDIGVGEIYAPCQMCGRRIEDSHHTVNGIKP